MQAVTERDSATDQRPLNPSARLARVKVLRTPGTRAQRRTLVDLLRKDPSAAGEFRRDTAKARRDRGPMPGTTFDVRLDRDSRRKIELLVTSAAISVSIPGNGREP